MSFDIKDLPYSQFEQIGMSKKDVINMKDEDLSKMLNGGRTSLVPLSIPLGEGMQPLQQEVKLSLSRNPDNTLSLGIHPVLAKAANTIGATPEQWDKLLKGEPIVKDTRAFNGQMEPHIHQLDKDTKEMLTTRVANIQIPNIIADNALTVSQKETLKNGQAIELDDKANQRAVTVRLDLNEPKGYSVQLSEQKINLQADQQLKNTVGPHNKEQREQAKTLVETPNIQEGQKLDNKLTTAFIVNFHPKNEPSLKDSYLALNNNDIYLRVSHLIEKNTVNVERFDSLNQKEFQAIQQKPRDHYEGKGTLVLASAGNGKGIEIKDSSLKTYFEKENSLRPSAAIAIAETPVISNEPSRGFKR
ncbi:DUF4099 domain-containing protein [Rufibacter sp. XAAS-G3-1]|uniref:DUF4099 domain-containing protein n=1 Tax=Rufibacter sp. XAAS-G3-1 TaxID=2729134 RepID=UPI0015E79CF3|nr:DUF4099 domain-containing protein [Rufibacter sp. XAAS-G3-1]